MGMDEFSPLDELLLDVAVQIELSPRDRRLADKRYESIEEHLLRPESPLRRIVETGVIYAQGSRATSTTIVTGTDDDRFDLDAILQIELPESLEPSEVLDLLEESLEDFPGIEGMKRCSRCLQLQFAFMHIDITPLDPDPVAVPRTGDIFHAPQDEPVASHGRKPSNPYGFALWFRGNVTHEAEFAKAIAGRREVLGRNILPDADQGAFMKAKAETERLPHMVDPQDDSPQVVALKLLKRALNLIYADLDLKRPPSVLLSKWTIDAGSCGNGLASHVIHLCRFIRGRIEIGWDVPSLIVECNPACGEELLTDRWPKAVSDVRQFFKALEHIEDRVIAAQEAEIGEAAKILESLFGERPAQAAAKALAERLERAKSTNRFGQMPGTGRMVLGRSAAAVASSAAAARPVARSQFFGGHRKK